MKLFKGCLTFVAVSVIMIVVFTIVVAIGSGGTSTEPERDIVSSSSDAQPTATRTPIATARPFVSGRSTFPPMATSAPKQSAGTYRVEYRATTTGMDGMSLTYQNAQGGTQQTKTDTMQWGESYTMDAGSFAYLSIQNQGANGSVTCEIYVDGKLWKTSRSDGGYTVASCSGSVGLD
jgi:hypothetical protein